MTTATQTKADQETIDLDLIYLDQALAQAGIQRTRLTATATEPAEELGFEVYYDESIDSVVVESPSEQFKFPLIDGKVPIWKIERWINDYTAEALVYIPF